MGWDTPDPYYSPEKFGLTPVASLEDDEPYQFDIFQVWRHDDGTLYYARDSGCSCPSPFEDYNSLDDLAVLDSFPEFSAAIWEDYKYYIDSEYSSITHQEVDTFLQGVERALKE